MDFQTYADQIIAFVRGNAAWAPPIVFALAFGESLAFISLLVPAWGALVAIGALIGTSGVSFWPIWIAAALGASFGDWLSYWIGLKLEHSVQHIWPLSRHPDLIPRGERFMKTWGIAGIFIGRFFGPLRAVVPVVAGMMDMPQARFQIANVISATVWLPALMFPGAFAGWLLNDRFPQFADQAFVYVFVALFLFPIIVGCAAWLRRRTRGGRQAGADEPPH